MKKFTYIRYITVAQTVSVMADSEDDAMQQVINASLPTLPYDFVAQECDLVDTEDVEKTIDDMEEQAIQILEEYYSRENADLDSQSNPSFFINVYEFSGGRIVDDKYVTTTAESYCVMDGNINIYTTDGAYIEISELGNAERYDVLKDIIESYELYGKI